MNLPVSVSSIERIEVLRGSAARIYGVNSLTGAINIVTIKPNKTGIEIQLNGGSNFKDNEEQPDKIYNSKGIEIAGSYVTENQITYYLAVCKMEAAIGIILALKIKSFSIKAT